MDTPNTHDLAKWIPLTHMIWLGTGTSVRSGRVHILENPVKTN